VKVSAKAGTKVFEVEVTREDGHYLVVVDGARHHVDALKLEGDFYSVLNGHRSYEVSVEPRRDGYHVRHGAIGQVVKFSEAGRSEHEGVAAVEGPEQIVSAMPGKVVRVLVAEGDAVEAGQGIVVVEAMKMENEIAAGKDGTVTALAVKAGQTVEGGGLLAVIE